jgi:hypothetical protein
VRQLIRPSYPSSLRSRQVEPLVSQDSILGHPLPERIHLSESELRDYEALVSSAAYPLCTFSIVLRHKFAQVRALWPCGEQQNEKICLPLGITTNSDFVFTRPRPKADISRTSLATNDPGFRQASLTDPGLHSCHRGEAADSRTPSCAGYPGDQVINSGEECSQNWGRVRLVISDDQIDGRRLAF